MKNIYHRRNASIDGCGCRRPPACKVFRGGVKMLSQEAIFKLDELAAPNNYVAIPTDEDIAYAVHFRQTCKRYNINFAKADQDERDFVIRMAEKSFYPKVVL